MSNAGTLLKKAANTASGDSVWSSPYLWATLLRLGFMIAIPRFRLGDSVDFHQLAENLANGHGFSRCFTEPFPPTAQRPPLYPMVLALVYLLGVGSHHAAALLNLLLDLFSMKFSQLWARQLGLSLQKRVPWVIGLCPLLITYGMYPTTENLSITLFFAAIYFFSLRHAVGSGLSWGLLSLCRSYYLLFPLVLLALKPFKSWSRKALAVLAIAGFAAPSVWMIRNQRVLHRASFSQTSTVGWQTYQGLCVANFDWWKPEHVALIVNDPLFAKMTQTHCSTEEEISALDKEALGRVRNCIVEQPFQTIRNVLAKGIMLFVNWGLFMPYDQVPFVLQHAVNAVICFFWLCAFNLVRKKKRNSPVDEYLRLSWITIAYVALVTIPFAVDARYLLGPFLMLLICLLEIARSPRKLLEAGLGK